MKFGSLELKYFEGCRLTQVVRNFGISDEHYFFAETSFDHLSSSMPHGVQVVQEHFSFQKDT